MSASWLSLENALDKALSVAHTVTECETVSLFSASNRIVATDHYCHFRCPAVG